MKRWHPRRDADLDRAAIQAERSAGWDRWRSGDRRPSDPGSRLGYNFAAFVALETDATDVPGSVVFPSSRAGVAAHWEDAWARFLRSQARPGE